VTRPSPKRNLSFAVAQSALVLVLLLVAIAAPRPAHAASEQILKPPPPGAFLVKGSNGYSIFVAGFAARAGERAAAIIFVYGKRGSATYVAPAKVTETSIDADFGSLGKIAVVFQASGQPRTEHPECSDDSVTFDSGYYEGTIAFHGEEGFTEVDATQASGSIGFLLSALCPGIGGSRGPFLPGAELKAALKGSRRDVHLKVVKNHRNARTHLEVDASEARNGISISRYTSIFAPPQAFEYDPLVRRAIIRPPAPFSGTAQFHRNAKPANRWTGNLMVDLPGRSNVKLTRRGMRTSLVHAHWDWALRKSVER
jgi:hypothetical protein